MRYLILLITLFGLSPLFAQNKKIITGVVKDTSELHLQGVTVQLKNTPIVTVTDSIGHFSIEAQNTATDILQFSSVGYQPIEQKVNADSEMLVYLVQETKTGDEVVVVAFGTQRKSTMVGSVTSIAAKEITGPTSNLTTMLAGRLAGVIAFQRSGEPGQDNANFFVRGLGNFGTGKRDPLIYIDGIESSNTDLARLQPDNIENFSLLKDANATALYGARGANGVILVTTKQGKAGVTKFNLRIDNRLSGNTRLYKLADNITYMKLANEAVSTRSANDPTPYDPSKIDRTLAGDDPILYPNNNWMELLVKDYTRNTSANFDVSGGSERARYYVSMTLDDNNGLMREQQLNNFKSNINLRTYTILSNINLKLTNTTDALVSIRGRFDDYTGPIGGGAAIFTAAAGANPVAYPAIYPQSYLPYAKHPLFGNAFVPGNNNQLLYVNPYAQAVSGFQESNQSILTPQVTINQSLKGISQGLTASVMAFTTRDAYFAVSRRYNPFYYQAFTVGGVTSLSLLNDVRNGAQIGVAPTEYLNYSQGEKLVSTVMHGQGSLNYARVFGAKHNIGGSFITMIRSSLSGNAGSLQASLPARNVTFAGRATYGYDNRYLFEYNFGYNASERFSKKNRWGFFPSIGGGWVVSNEKFFEPLLNTINNFKLRFTYGKSGNDAIGNANERFFYLSEVNFSGGGYTFGENFNFFRNGVNTLRYANEEITWEESTQINGGFDISILKNLNIVVDAYNRKVENILLARNATVPTTLGLQAAVVANTGRTDVKGVETAITYNSRIGSNFGVTSRATFTYNKNKIIATEEPHYPENINYVRRTGSSGDQIFGLIAERLFTDEREVANSPQQSFGQYMAGDIKYRDLNDDGRITNLDLAPIGWPVVPEITYGFGGTVDYKGLLDFSIFFQGSARSSFIINPNATAPFVLSGGGANGFRQAGLLDVIAKDHWSEDNRNPYAFWPRLSQNIVANNTQTSTWWLQNGNFLRIKQAEIGFNPNAGLLKKIGLDFARIYLSGQNLFTFTSFKLWDIEMGGNGLGYPLQRVYNLGVRVGF